MSSEEVKKTVISSRGVCGNGHVVWTTPPTSSKYERESAPALSSGTLAKAAGCQWYSGGSSKLAALARDPAAAPGIR